jgi:hypothetical protein
MQKILKYMPEAMAVSCKECGEEVLVLRKPPHGIAGTINSTLSGVGLRQLIFFADGGELIVSDGDEI